MEHKSQIHKSNLYRAALQNAERYEVKMLPPGYTMVS